MKRLIILVCTLFFASQGGATPQLSADSLFQLAEQAYAREGYTAAGQLYAQALATNPDFDSAALRYNQSLAFAKADSLGLAHHAILKALYFDPNNDEYRQVRQYIEDRLQGAVTFDSSRGLFAVGGWVMLLAIAVLSGGVVWWFSPGRLPFLIRKIILIGSLIGLAVLIGHLIGFYLETNKSGVVLHSKQELRESPYFESVGVPVSAGQLAMVVDREGDWVQIVLPDGVGGWIPSAQFGLVVDQ